MSGFLCGLLDRAVAQSRICRGIASNGMSKKMRVGSLFILALVVPFGETIDAIRAPYTAVDSISRRNEESSSSLVGRAFSKIWNIVDTTRSFLDCGGTQAPDSIPGPATPAPSDSPVPYPTKAPTEKPNITPGPSNKPTDPPVTQAPASKFSIALDLVNVASQTEFYAATSKWTKVITGDLPDVSIPGGSSSCGLWPDRVDDVYICGKFSTIDGPGGVLGSAGKFGQGKCMAMIK
jgi:hypothetical protein